MKHWREILTIILLSSVASHVLAQEIKAITGATLIDGAGRAPIKDAVIIIEGARIKQAGAKSKIKIPKEATVIDARGKFVAPGLADMHNHLLDGTLSRRPQALTNVRRLLACGVTTVFYPNANLQLLARLRKEAAADNAPYPRVFSTGPIITVKGGSLSPDFRSPETPDEARAVVKELKEAGVEAIKLGYDDNTWAMKTASPLMKTEIVAAVIAEAHQQGLKVFVHAPLLEQAKAVLRAGADGLMHGVIDRPVDDEFLSLMKKNRAVYVSTLALFENVGDTAAWARRQADEDERKLYPASVYEFLSSPNVASFLNNASFTRERLSVLRANLKRVHSAGIPLVIGTDTGFPGVLLGVASHLEMLLHAEAGLKNDAIIRAATINAARMIGREKDLGAVEAGKFADLLILDANPLDDIRNLKRIHRVIKGGAIFDPAELLKQ
jgi:imidazolonepropionase-like amidohydrolase